MGETRSPLPQKLVIIALLLLVQQVFLVPSTNRWVRSSASFSIWVLVWLRLKQSHSCSWHSTFRSDSTWVVFVFFLMQPIITLKKDTEGTYTKFCLWFLTAATRINLLNTCGNPYIGLSGSWETGRSKYCFNYNLFFILILLKWKW